MELKRWEARTECFRIKRHHQRRVGLMHPSFVTTQNLSRSILLGVLLTLPLPVLAAEAVGSCGVWRELIVHPAQRTAVVDFRQVGAANPTPSDPLGFASLSDSQTVDAIACLLDAEADSRPASISGSIGQRTGQIFEPAPANLAALYYISYLFKRRYAHASGVGLRGEDAGHEVGGQYVTRPEAIRRAYSSYRKWFARLKKIGLCKARATGLDPLEASGLWWYGNPPTNQARK